MAYAKVRTDVMWKAGQKPSRWMPRAEAKKASKKARRQEDKRAA